MDTNIRILPDSTSVSFNSSAKEKFESFERTKGRVHWQEDILDETMSLPNVR